MNFDKLPLPTSESKKMKYLRELKINQLHRLKREMEAREVPNLLAHERNRFLSSQESHY